MTAEADVALSELQIILMRVLWRNGETSVSDVAAALVSSASRIENSATNGGPA